MALCSDVSGFFGLAAVGKRESTVIVSSRESTCAYLRTPLQLAPLSQARKLHVSFDMTPELPGKTGNECALHGKNLGSRNTIVQICFADLGFPPASSPLPRLPDAYRTIRRDLRDTIRPFADTLATSRARQRAEHAAVCLESKAVSNPCSHVWSSCEPILRNLGTLLRETPRLLQQTAAIGTADALRFAQKIPEHLGASFEEGRRHGPGSARGLIAGM